MIENFSSGYYRAEMRVEEYDDGPVIDRELYNFIDYNLYAESTAPIMMRVGLDADGMFAVSAEAGVPSDVLALPQDVGPDEGEVFLLKSEYADMIGGYNG